MNNKTKRDIQRIIHIGGGIAIAVGTYTPLGTHHFFILSMQYFTVPAMTLTGLYLWQGTRITKWFKQGAT